MLMQYNKVQVFACCVNPERVCCSEMPPPLQIPRPTVAPRCQLFRRFVVGASRPRRREERCVGTGEATRRKEDIREASPFSDG